MSVSPKIPTRVSAFTRGLIMLARVSLLKFALLVHWVMLGHQAQGGTLPYNQTKYPVVMVPGAFSFDNVLGAIDYWYGITDTLREAGAEVYVTNLGSSELLVERGEELLADVEQILAITGADKVNLIAHSQGATAARYVSSVLPGGIASVSCFNCMNEGTKFADNLYDFVNKRHLLKGFVNKILSGLFTILEIVSGWSSDGTYNSPDRGYQIAENLVIASGTASHSKFNEMFPEGLPDSTCHEQGYGKEYRARSGKSFINGVQYYSLGGTTAVTNWIDPLDSLLVPVVRLFYPNGHIWDGMVPSCGHPLGELVEGFYPINHFDAINQSFGIIESGVDIPSIYSIHVNRLQKAGL